MSPVQAARLVGQPDNGLVPDERRCGTCKHWDPNSQPDKMTGRYYGVCRAPEPVLPHCYLLRAGPRWMTTSAAGEDCPTWLAGGTHGDLE